MLIPGLLYTRIFLERKMAVIRELSSRENSAVKNVRRLIAESKARQKQGLFAVQGITLCEEVLACGVPVDSVFFTDRALSRAPGLMPLIENAPLAYRVTDPVMQYIASLKEPEGIVCVCKMLDKGQKLDTINMWDKLVLLDNLRDPGNLGTIIRTACALGMDAVLLTEGCCDLYSDKVLRGCMGALFRMPVIDRLPVSETVDRLRQKGVQLYATALRDDAQPIGSVAFETPFCVAFGNEANGISPELLARCDHTVIIPMRRGTESLNVASAAAIVLWESTKNA